MRTLRGRIALSLALFGLATLVAVGGALFLGLRNLYRDQATAALADLAVPYVAQVRRFGGRGGENSLAALVADLQELAADASTSLRVYVVGPSGAAVRLGDAATPTTLTLALPDQMGEVVRGVGTIDGLGAVAYAAAPVVGERTPSGARFLVFARPDDSSSRALGDILRALAIAAVVLLLIGVPLALWLSGSVARPLARLAAATGAVARGDIPIALPTDGPAEVAQASAAFNTMAMEVARGRESQRQLVADLRHDLRTPITVIGGFAKALRDGTAQGDAIGRAAELIADEADRLERMLGDLGALADLERGGRAMAPERLDVMDVLRDAAARFEPVARARGLQLEVEPATATLAVHADRLAVDRIVANLVANAMAHTRSRIWLEASSVARDGGIGRMGVRLAVRDDGPGIPPEALPRVFDRFFRGDAARSGTGSGLGLAIVAELAVAQGGRAFAESPPGHGARVGVVLPTVDGDPVR